MNIVIQELLPVISAFIGALLTGVGGYAFGKRKINAEAESAEAEAQGKDIDNADKLVKLYKEAIDDLGSRYEVKFKEVTTLYESKIKLLEDEINLHKRIIAQLKEENTTLRKKIKDSGIII